MSESLSKKISWRTSVGCSVNYDVDQLESKIGVLIPGELTSLYRRYGTPGIVSDFQYYPEYTIINSGLSVQDYGYAIDFYSTSEDEPLSSVIEIYYDLSRNLGNEFVPIARDGSDEMLLLRYDSGDSDPTVWHYCPSYRIHPNEKLFKVADSFGEFLGKIYYVEDEYFKKHGK